MAECARRHNVFARRKRNSVGSNVSAQSILAQGVEFLNPAITILIQHVRADAANQEAIAVRDLIVVDLTKHLVWRKATALHLPVVAAIRLKKNGCP